MSGGTSSGRRGRWLIVALVLAFCGAAAGVWAGRRIAEDDPAVVVAVAVAGFGLGGLVGMLGLGLRALLMRAIRLFDRSRNAAAVPPDAPPQAAPSPPAPDPEPEPATEQEPELEAEPEPQAPAEPEPLPAPPAGEQPGWYPDPHEPGRNRYWDGRTWTAHVSRDRETRPRRGSRPRRSR